MHTLTSVDSIFAVTISHSKIINSQPRRQNKPHCFAIVHNNNNFYSILQNIFP